MVVNSAAVSPTTGKVYFTASSDIPPRYTSDGYYTPMVSAYLTLSTVRAHCCFRSCMKTVAARLLTFVLVLP